jgi:hypothetical protein
MLLESLLRQFEYQAGFAAAFMKKETDPEHLRRELGMGAE